MNSTATYIYPQVLGDWSLDEQVRQRFRAAERLLSGATYVLDVGCRDGTFSLALARKGMRVTGVDTDSTAVAAANAEAGRQGLEKAVFFDGDLLDPALPARIGRFPAVVAMEVIEHMPDQAAALRALGGLVEVGGIMVVSVPANTHISDPDHRTIFWRESVDRDQPDAEWSQDCPWIWLMFRIRRPPA